MDNPLLSVENLSIAYHRRGQAKALQVVANVSFAIEAGQSVVLVGESGSGKTTTIQAILGLLPPSATITQGEININGSPINHRPKTGIRSLYGRTIGLIPQDPYSSLDPLMRVGDQIAEIFTIHKIRPRATIKQRVLSLLKQVGLSEPERRFYQYPHELSGGMRQRVLIAIAIALKPQLIIADEPTSALDVTVQRRILDVIDTIRNECNTALLMVTHDLGIASDRAENIIVMHKGRIEEAGDSRTLLARPRSQYTKRLLANDPSLTVQPHRRHNFSGREQLITLHNVNIVYQGQRRTHAVKDLSFAVMRGSTHAIVGESGSGKTSTIRALCGFSPIESGEIIIGGIKLRNLNGEELRHFRRKIQLVYQDPYSSFDPSYRIGAIIEEPLHNYQKISHAERRRRVAELLELVELGEEFAHRSPHALSGGQRQRVAIARALILQPEILVLDEAVSALDVTVQAQILKLLERLQDESGLTYVFVSHDLSVVRRIADSVTVMRHGRAIETGTVQDIFTHPAAPYTRELIAAIPGKVNALNKSLLSAQL